LICVNLPLPRGSKSAALCLPQALGNQRRNGNEMLFHVNGFSRSSVESSPRVPNLAVILVTPRTKCNYQGSALKQKELRI
jgi:hypothetical protein